MVEMRMYLDDNQLIIFVSFQNESVSGLFKKFKLLRVDFKINLLK